MTDRTCTADGCGRQWIARGMCTMHYQRFMQHERPAPQAKRTCSVDGCERDAGKREYCRLHRRRLLAHGTTELPGRPVPGADWLARISVPPGARAVPVLIPRTESFTFVLVDEADYEAVAKWRWRLSLGGYAHRGHWDGERSVWMYMHRHIMQTPKGVETDHINRDKQDNRRSNLRFVDRSLNSFNQSPSKANTSGVKGVSWFKPAQLWRAYINHKSEPKRIELGYFRTFEAAVATRRAAEERYFGECA